MLNASYQHRCIRRSAPLTRTDITGFLFTSSIHMSLTKRQYPYFTAIQNYSLVTQIWHFLSFSAQFQSDFDPFITVSTISHSFSQNHVDKTHKCILFFRTSFVIRVGIGYKRQMKIIFNAVILSLRILLCCSTGQKYSTARAIFVMWEFLYMPSFWSNNLFIR